MVTNLLRNGAGLHHIRRWSPRTPPSSSAFGHDTTSWLHRHGWTTRLHDIGEVARGYGREISTGGFVTAILDTPPQHPPG